MSGKRERHIESFDEWFERTQKLPATDVGAFHHELIWTWANAYAKYFAQTKKREIANA